MIGTSNTDVATVPQVSSTSETPKPKREHKPKVKTPDAVSLAVAKAVSDWKHGMAPAGLDAGAKVLRFGQDTGKKRKDGSALTSRSLVISTPTGKALRDANPSLSVADATARSNEIGHSIKPMLMGRVAAAGSSANYIVRRYSETPSDKGKHRIGVTLERVVVEDVLERIARELKMTRADVAKRLGIKEETTSIVV